LGVEAEATEPDTVTGTAMTVKVMKVEVSQTALCQWYLSFIPPPFNPNRQLGEETVHQGRICTLVERPVTGLYYTSSIRFVV
jgi:hypothetical protein